MLSHGSFFNRWVPVMSLLGLMVLFCYQPRPSHVRQKPFISESEEEEGIPLRDRMDLAILQEIELTKDPATGTVPKERLIAAYDYAQSLRNQATGNRIAGAIAGVNWTERGPNNIGGRTRAIMFDPTDATGNTVWAAGVGGGLWKTTNISATNPVWTPVNDLFDNLAITTLAYNPVNTSERYFGTGEGFYNVDAIRGNGIWKSTNGGISYSPLASTVNNANFRYIEKIVVQPVTGYVFAGTRLGLFRSTDGGATWTKVLGALTGATNDPVSDIEITSDNVIIAAIGLMNTDGIYRSSTGAAGSWTKLNTATSGFPTTGIQRIELACAPSNAQIIYAVTQNTANAAGGVYVSTNQGTSWTTKTKPTDADAGIGTDFTRGQAWYDFSLAVDPNNQNTLFIGGIDLFRSTDGATSWQQVSHWYGGFGYQYTHADQHAAIYKPGSSTTILFGNDGGVFASFNANAASPVIDSKSFNYNVTQYYACAMHPTAYSSYFLAGAQDNGSHKFTQPGINSVSEASGGDGCFTHIDQDQPQYQFTSYVYNNYYRSTDGGNTFTSITNNNNGSFVNPSDYDNLNNNLYAANGAGNYYRMLNAPTTATLTSVNVAAFSSGTVTHVSCSPNTANRVFFGLSNGLIVKVDNANATNSATNITGTGMVGSVSCVAIETGNDNHLLATYSNYGITSVWETTNGGTSWTSVEGNLPDMPVRWALFNPSNATQALIATELGVWSTDLLNGVATIWGPSASGIPNTRVDMLQIRTSDKLVAAATHGRGLFTSDVFTTASADFGANKRLAYTTKQIQFSDASYKSTSWNWDFGDGTTSTVKNPLKSYSSPGLYTVTLSINGGASQKVNTGYIQILPNKGVPFMANNGGSFDSDPLFFGSETFSGTSFERGNSTVANKNGTRSGSFAWVTGLTSTNYLVNTDTRLWSPNFNMSIPGTYTLSFYRKNTFEAGYDGFIVEYTLNRGDTWIALGNTVSTNWYDFANSAAQTAFPLNQAYFNLQKTTFTLCQYNVSSLAGNSSVGFRIRFKSDDAVTAAGLAIDDFELTGPTNTPLPVQLVSFRGTALDSNNELKWTTLSEVNNDHFEIERSLNGIDFYKIGMVSGNGTVTYRNDYSFDDRNVSPRKYYYRLKQLDFDGQSAYSGIVSIDRSSILSMKVFPNPFKNDLNIVLPAKDSEAVVELTDLKGKLVYKKIVRAGEVFISVSFAEMQIPAGVYLLRVAYDDVAYTEKVFSH